MNDKLIISNTNISNPEFQIYNISETEGPYADTLTLLHAITAPAIPNTLYSTGNLLFVGMADHGGVQVYSLDNSEIIDEVAWLATGFSIKEIYWDNASRLLLLSCGYQGVVVLELDENLVETNSWILNTNYAYAACNYMDQVIVATRNGLEIIDLSITQ